VTLRNGSSSRELFLSGVPTPSTSTMSSGS
jgi:hypothetical protein